MCDSLGVDQEVLGNIWGRDDCFCSGRGLPESGVGERDLAGRVRVFEE